MYSFRLLRTHQLKQWIFGQMLHSELSLACISWISLSQNSMSKTRDNLQFENDSISSSAIWDRDYKVLYHLLNQHLNSQKEGERERQTDRGGERHYAEHIYIHTHV